MKEFYCKTCGETDPEYFYVSNKSRCKCCILGKTKEEYNPQDKHGNRKVKPYHCKDCGETDSNEFQHGLKSRCKKCMSIWSSKQYYPTSTPICFDENGRKIKPYHCKDCGETDPKKFKNGLKGRCNECQTEFTRKKYIPVLRTIKPYLCQYCGETDSNKFNTGSKTKCRTCSNIIYAHKDRDLSIEEVLEIKRIKAIPKPPKPIKEPYIPLPHLCKHCGETDPKKFHNALKTKCRACENEFERIKYRKKRGGHLSKDFQAGRLALKSVKRRSNRIRFLIKKNKKLTDIEKLRSQKRFDVEQHRSQKRFVVEQHRYHKQLVAGIKKNIVTRRREIRYAIKNLRKIKTGSTDRGNQSLSQQEFEDKVKLRHGNRYGFDKTVYKNSRTPVIITCTKHNYDFEVKPSILLGNKKKGKIRKNMVGSCPVCQQEYWDDIREQFIEKLRKAHNYEYEYDVENYVNVKTPFDAICSKHGRFSVYPSRHVKGEMMCPFCELEDVTMKVINGVKYYNCVVHGSFPVGKSRTKSQGCPRCKFEAKQIKKSGERALNRVGYNNKTISVLIKKARRIKSDFNPKGRGNQSLSQQEFEAVVREHNGDKYSFEKTRYTKKENKVWVTCVKHSYDFEVRAYSLMRNNHGSKPKVGCCPVCQQEYQKSKPRKPRVYRFKKLKLTRFKPSFKVIGDKKYFSCETHGNVEVGKNRSYKQGCPTCNIERHQRVLADNRALKPKIYVFEKWRRGGKSKPRPKSYDINEAVLKGRTPKASYEVAKERVRRNGVKSSKEYRAWTKRTAQHDLPYHPEKTYKGKGWVDYWEFFGTSKYTNMSSGAQRIYDYLQRKDIEFETEKKFEDCRNIHCLRFDFYLPKLHMCIEFDGEQHQRPSNFSTDPEKNKRKFLQLQINDGIKNDYCKNNNIPLIRLDDEDLANNVIEWCLDEELRKIRLKAVLET